MGHPRRFQSHHAATRAAELLDQHGIAALDAANAALAQAVRAGDQTEMNLLCETCLILLRSRGWAFEAKSARGPAAGGV